MLKWLSNLRKKPESYRKKATILISLGFTLIVIILWLSVLFAGFRVGSDNSISIEEVDAPIDSLRSAASSALSSFGEFFEGSVK